MAEIGDDLQAQLIGAQPVTPLFVIAVAIRDNGIGIERPFCYVLVVKLGIDQTKEIWRIVKAVTDLFGVLELTFQEFQLSNIKADGLKLEFRIGNDRFALAAADAILEKVLMQVLQLPRIIWEEAG